MIAEDLVSSAFNGLASHIAVLDPAGFIVYVNAAWHRFAVLDIDQALTTGVVDSSQKNSADFSATPRQRAEALHDLVVEPVHDIKVQMDGNRLPWHLPHVVWCVGAR